MVKRAFAAFVFPFGRDDEVIGHLSTSAAILLPFEADATKARLLWVEELIGHELSVVFVAVNLRLVSEVQIWIMRLSNFWPGEELLVEAHSRSNEQKNDADEADHDDVALSLSALALVVVYSDVVVNNINLNVALCHYTCHSAVFINVPDVFVHFNDSLSSW